MNSIGMPGRGQADAGGDARAAAAEPGSRIARIAEPGDAQLAPFVDDVVILRALDEAPRLGESVRPEAARQAVHVERPLVGGAGVRR